MIGWPPICLTTMSWRKTCLPLALLVVHDLREQLDQVVVADLDRRARVGDVEDVDVGRARCCPTPTRKARGPVLPDEDASGRSWRSASGSPARVVPSSSKSPKPCDRAVTGLRRVGDVVEVEAAAGRVRRRAGRVGDVGAVGLVVDGQHVALEAGRVERDHMGALAVVVRRLRRDEGDLLRARRDRGCRRRRCRRPRSPGSSQRVRDRRSPCGPPGRRSGPGSTPRHRVARACRRPRVLLRRRAGGRRVGPWRLPRTRPPAAMRAVARRSASTCDGERQRDRASPAAASPRRTRPHAARVN